MNTSTFSRYRSLIKYIKNWPVYFLNKWRGQPAFGHYHLRKHGISIIVPKDTLRVFKEFFMTDSYSFDQLLAYLPKNSVVIDIGANIGMFPIRLLADQPDITFYSFEPFPNNFEILQRNIKNNELTNKKVHIFHEAVLGEKENTLKLYFNKDQPYTDSSSIIQGFENNFDFVTIPGTTLKEIYETNKLQQINMLKLDCEGSEYSILYKSPPELLKKIPFIIVETHDLDDLQNNIKGAKEYLGKLGFTCKILPVTDKINMVWAWQ